MDPTFKEIGPADAPVPMSPVADLYAFATDLPAWQAELIRLIYERGGDHASDVADGLAMLRQGEGFADGDAPAVTARRPITPPDATVDPAVLLLAVGDLVSVNRLPTGSPLRFAASGLTVIYGENGSGKSGFCRVIKAACGGGAVVLPDVFAPQGDTPRGTITYSVNGRTKTFDWSPTAVLPDPLARVTVFDAVRAPLYVDQERRLGFLPRGLEVLPALGRVMTAMGAQLDAELRTAEAGTPSVGVHASSGTTVRGILDRIPDEQDPPTDEEIAALARLTDDERSELAALEAALGGDPAARAGRLDAAITRLRSLETGFNVARETMSAAAVQRLAGLGAALEAARTAAELASQVALDGVTVLPAAGSEPWRLMFEFARAYMALARPDRPFPDPATDALCPVCQQPLGDDARDRLTHFAEFLDHESQANLAEVSQHFDSERQGIGLVSVPTQLDVSALGLVDQADAPGLAALAEALEILRGGLEDRRAAILAANAGTAAPLGPEPDVLDIDGVVAQLEARADALRAATRDETRASLLARLEELRARASLEEGLAAVHGLRAHLRTIVALRRCRTACDTGVVSRKNSELRRRYLTDEFERNFREELAQLGLGNLAVRPADRTERGENLISIALDAAMRVRVREVLSDGEIRAVGLAGFLADCRRIGASPPIVLDDPVSSLDHQRIRAIAQRLVDESEHRQVIVFTHSILLLWELWELATDRRVPLQPHWLRVEGGVPGGVMENTVPWEAAAVRTRLGRLEERLAAARRTSDLTGDEYRGAVRLFYGDLRDTWERLVEELLFNGVIGRFKPGVETQKLRKVEVTDDDYRVIETNMARTSQFEHSQAPAREQALPRPDELEADLVALRDFSDSVRARLGTVDARRRDGQRPPTATVAPGA